MVPDALWARLNDSQYAGERVPASTRISQWTVALQLIAEHPWFGWGAAAFSILYPLRTGQWHGHAHNLPLELAISHGLPAASLVVGLVLALMVVSLRRGLSGLVRSCLVGSTADPAGAAWHGPAVLDSRLPSPAGSCCRFACLVQS